MQVVGKIDGHLFHATSYTVIAVRSVSRAPASPREAPAESRCFGFLAAGPAPECAPAVHLAAGWKSAARRVFPASACGACDSCSGTHYKSQAPLVPHNPLYRPAPTHLSCDPHYFMRRIDMASPAPSGRPLPGGSRPPDPTSQRIKVPKDQMIQFTSLRARHARRGRRSYRRCPRRRC